MIHSRPMKARHLSAALRPSDRSPPDAGGRAAGRGAQSDMTIKGKAYIAGIFEHPTRKADEKSLAQLHAEAAAGALGDAGLTHADVDGYFCAGDAPGLGGSRWPTTWGSRSATSTRPRAAARPT